jgi:selenocysteine lyase/cysteine desulfurase
VKLVTPENDMLYAAMVTIRFQPDDLRPLFAAMEKKGIWILGGKQMRLSVHVHTRPEDIDAFFAVADRLLP